MYDLLVIGGGVVGAMTLREAAKYKLKAILLEATDDLSSGASRANSGIVHAGYDAVPGTLKARFNVEGNKCFEKLCEELDTPYRKTGSLVAAGENGMDGLKELLDRAKANGVEAEIIGRDRILEIEPNIADGIEYALWAPEAGIASPYKLTIHAGDWAVLNGAEVKLEEPVTAIEKIDGGYKVITPKGSYETKTVVNSAGANAVKVNAMLGEKTPETEYRRGEYYVLDKTEGGNVSTVIFPLPDERGKGILVAPTADGNVIYGPTSVLSDAEDTSVQLSGLAEIRKGVSKTYKCPNFRKAIRLYAGVRAAVGSDFVIEEGVNKGYFMLLGICSPGLTASPAIAKYVIEELVSKYIKLEKKDQTVALEKQKRITKMSREELDALAKTDSRWARIICRCETVSEMEIINAIHSPVPATTVDAVKRRVRAGMGRCQGGFCMPFVMKILARELNLPITAIRKGGEGTNISLGAVEEVTYEF